MKSFLLNLLTSSLLLFNFNVHTLAQREATTYVPTPENLKAREQFDAQRFGIFLHWGIYSLFAQGEWYMQDAAINRSEYAKAANAFYPHDFDAAKWVSAFKAAGAKYVCFTSRHHDGFSMWHTKQSDFNISHTPYKKDIVKMLADECHKQGLGFHLYYSHIDWTRDDYPMGRTGRYTGKDASKANWQSYFRFMNAQLTELLTNYGQVDGIWFDGWWDHERDEKPFDWQLSEQYALIHQLQPACIIGNNHHQTPYPGEDMQMFERDIPGENKAGLSGQSISQLPLETCETMNDMWGYKVADQNYKSTTSLLRLLVRSAAKGANLLLNIGPQPDGNLPDAALSHLREMGQWLNGPSGESIYNTLAGTIQLGDSIVSTQRKNITYLHLLTNHCPEQLILPITPKKLRKVQLLGEDAPLRFRKGTNSNETLISLSTLSDNRHDYILKLYFK